MIYCVPFEAAHLMGMAVQKAQAWLPGSVTEQDAKGLEGRYSTTLVRDGKPLACAGVLEYWPGRALLWCVLSADVDARFFPVLHREAKRWLDGLPIRRLEASVDVPFKNGHRWMWALGFKIEAPLQRYFQPNGADSVGYVRLKD